MSTLHAFNFRQWIEENRHLLQPPVGNKVVFRDSDFIIMVVGGPNARKDYHIDPSEEFFYQLQGNMVLKTDQDGKLVDVPINEGDVFLLPANVPHSPRRPGGSIGLVIERARKPQEIEGFRWYCERCGHRLHEEFLHVSDIETQMQPVFDRFYSNEQRRTCTACQSVLLPPG